MRRGVPRGAARWPPQPGTHEPPSPARRRYPNRYESVLGMLCENLETLSEPEAKAAMVWMLGEYAERIDKAGAACSAARGVPSLAFKPTMPRTRRGHRAQMSFSSSFWSPSQRRRRKCSSSWSLQP